MSATYEDYKVVEVKTKEEFDIEENECYESVGHPQVPKRKEASSEVTRSLNKHGKLLFVMVAVMAVILTVTSALIAAEYVENIRMKKEIENLQEKLLEVATLQQITSSTLSTYQNLKENLQEELTPVISENMNATNKLQLEVATLQQTTSSTLSAYRKLKENLQEGLTQVISENTNATNKLQLEVATLQQTTSSILSAYQNFTYILETRTEQLENKTQLLVGQCSISPVSSCASVDSSSPSGYYWVMSSSGSAVLVYCDMTRSCGNTIGGWMRVAHFNMSNNSTQCPSGFTEQINSSIRNCIQSTTAAGCASVNYQTNSISYSHICGMVRAYQIRTTDGFEDFGDIRPTNRTVDTNYVDGVSLTHGMNPRQHIWSFAAGNCPCSTNKPLFVGNDYSCDGETRQCENFCGFVLWDGDGCQSNNRQWFHKQLPQSSTDNIQMRLCRDEDRDNEDIAFEIVEILVR